MFWQQRTDWPAILTASLLSNHYDPTKSASVASLECMTLCPDRIDRNQNRLNQHSVDPTSWVPKAASREHFCFGPGLSVFHRKLPARKACNMDLPYIEHH